jgi:4-hydroxy-3-methylbut-2-enyl diphosphate reductase
MAKEKVPTYFILNAACLESADRIRYFDTHAQQEVSASGWLPCGPITVGITAGASCPSNLIEDVLLRLLKLKGVSENTAV